MNTVILFGNLTRDPEVREVGEKKAKVANFSLAVNRHFKRADGTKDEEVTYVDCEAWDTGANTIETYCSKGDPLLIQGSLKMDQWENDNGEKRSKLKVRVTSFKLIGGRKNSDDAPKASPKKQETVQYMGEPGDPEIPF